MNTRTARRIRHGIERARYGWRQQRVADALRAPFVYHPFRPHGCTARAAYDYTWDRAAHNAPPPGTVGWLTPKAPAEPSLYDLINSMAQRVWDTAGFIPTKLYPEHLNHRPEA